MIIACYLYCLRLGATVKYIGLVTSILCNNIQRVLTLRAQPPLRVSTSTRPFQQVWPDCIKAEQGLLRGTQNPPQYEGKVKTRSAKETLGLEFTPEVRLSEDRPHSVHERARPNPSKCPPRPYTGTLLYSPPQRTVRIALLPAYLVYLPQYVVVGVAW